MPRRTRRDFRAHSVSASRIMPIRLPRLALPVALLLAAPAAGAQQGPATSTETPVYLEFQVERPAEGAPGGCYPAMPKRVNSDGSQHGEVLVEFVVDTVGRADTASLKMLKATHPELGQAVRKAIPCMRFRPAAIDGRPVRQLVQQSFGFKLLK